MGLRAGVGVFEMLAREFLVVTYKAVPIQAWIDPKDFISLRLLTVSDNRLMKVARLSVLHAGRLYPQEISETTPR
jgi:hypothetical protein